MLNPDIFLTLAQQTSEMPSLFPFPLPLHIVFAVLGLAFFIYRFITDKKPFQLIFAVAIPFSLTLWISDSRTWFYIVGLVELILIIAAFITSIIFKDKAVPEENSEEITDSEVQE